MKRTIYYLFLLLVILSAGCQNQEQPQVDLSAPTIDIVEPLDGLLHNAETQVRILINIEENQELHEFSIVIRNEDRTYTKTLMGGHLHASSHHIDEYFQLPELTEQVYTLTVKASDHNDNLTTAQVELLVP